MIAMLFATVAFSIDAMLPALPEIAATLTPEAPNRAQLIVTVFMLGMGVGTLLVGPLSDTVGRKPVILGGAALYMTGAALAWAAPTIETMLVARLIQGTGAAAPRVVGIAIVRDLYAGRPMARIMSFVMMVFTLVPAAAPLLGSLIIAAAGWRAVFAAFLLFSFAAASWLALRQPETLPPEARRSFRLRPLARAAVEVVSNRDVMVATAAQTLVFATLVVTISTIQPVFDRSFGRADTFPLWFGGIALLSASGSLLNAALVERLGMRRIAATALGAQVAIATGVVLAFWSGIDGAPAFALYLLWALSLFLLAALTVGNLNALAMEPVGHVAGMASSVIGAVASVGAVLIATPIGLAFDGTPLPLAVGVAAVAAAAWALTRLLRDAEPARA